MRGLVNQSKQEQSKTVTPDATGFTVTPDAGKALSSVVVNGDPDLISGNIKSGINIFGVAGNSNVVDTSGGDATATDILSGKKAYADGSLITGTASAAPVSVRYTCYEDNGINTVARLQTSYASGGMFSDITISPTASFGHHSDSAGDNDLIKVAPQY